jgi:carbon-monoxide dehydrogenase medium subunit
MYPAPFDYHRPATLNEALHLLTTLGGAATVLAGGQSLIPMMKLRVGEFRHVVDIGRLSGLAYIERRGDTVHIGALARHAQIAASTIVQEIPLLADVAGGIADRQVRTMGTIGGGLAMADSSACWPTGLRTAGAKAVCTGPKGVRTVTIDELILDSYATCLDSDEIITEIQVPLPAPGSGAAYIAFKRSAAAYPTVAVGMMLELDGDSCRRSRIVLGGAGATTVVSSEAESVLRGSAISTELLEKAASVIVAASSPPSDARGSESFKRAMLRSLVVEAGTRALVRARGEQLTGGHRYA